MATKLEAFLTENKIDQRRLLAASERIERLRPQDRATKLIRRQARKKEDAPKPTGLEKPRSGRPVSRTTLGKAVAGKTLSGPAKTRILRAVNHILGQRKQPEVALGSLFENLAVAVSPSGEGTATP
jgi:hypothetical protein